MKRLSVKLWAICALLTACTVSGPPAPPRVVIIPTTKTPIPISTATPTIIPTPTITPTPTATPCTQTAGELVEFPYPRNAADHLTKVYLPPCYQTDLTRTYPVVYVIHGQGGGPNSWFANGTKKMLDQLIASNAVEPFLVVSPFLPYGYYSHVPWLTGELIPLIDAAYRTKTDRLYRGLAGRSAGGGEAQWQAFQYPEFFGAVQLISSVTIDEATPLARENDRVGYNAFLPAIPNAYISFFYIAIGEQDNFLQGNLNLALYLKNNKIPFTLSVTPGGHNQAYWSANAVSFFSWWDTVFGVQTYREK